MTFSALLDRTLRLYRANFRPLALVAAVVAVIQLPLAVISAPASRGGTPLGGWALFLGVFTLGGLITTPIIIGATCHLAVAVLKGRAVGAAEALRAGISRFGSLLGFWILTGLAATGGAILLIVPGFYIGLGFALGGVAIMDEGLGAIAAMKRSWRLMKGRRLRVFGLIFMWAILQLVIGYAVGVVFGAVLPDAFAAALSQQVASVLVIPCWALSLAIIFEHARLEREGHDLAIDAQRLANAPPSDPSSDPSWQRAR
ncbi:MAG TPA: hypothetical protein VGG33_00435 [Polyangia bacterium]